MGKITVNAVGKQCPIPVVEATRALRAMTESMVLEAFSLPMLMLKDF